MCGRFIFDGDIADIIEKYEILKNSLEAYSIGEIFPSNSFPVVVNRSVMELTTMNWGFSASYLKGLVINARGETVNEKPMFKKLLTHHRCIIPATGYFEWKALAGKKRKHLIAQDSGEIFSMAGLYGEFIDSKGSGYMGFTIITTDAAPDVVHIHDRMPVILNMEEVKAWLNPEYQDIYGIKAMLKPYCSTAAPLKVQEL